MFTDVRKHLDWIKSIIEGEERNRQISDQLSRHHETASERIFNRNPSYEKNKQSGHHSEYKQKQHNHFDQVIVDKLTKIGKIVIMVCIVQVSHQRNGQSRKCYFNLGLILSAFFLLFVSIY